MCARIFPCRVFFKRTETSSTHILTSVIKLPNCLELVQNKFCRKKIEDERIGGMYSACMMCGHNANLNPKKYTLELSVKYQKLNCTHLS